MFNYKLTIEYNGEQFFGSQRQKILPELRTVQAELEKVLELYFQEQIETVFAGRTDAGVHAIGQVVSFKSSQAFRGDFDRVLLRLNAQATEDLVITKIEEVAENFNARFDAKSREYLYKLFIRRQRPVLRKDSLGWFKDELDFELMQKHCKNFLGKQDFSPYAKEERYEDSEKIGRTGICEVYEARLVKESKICYKFHVKANRFLRNMVRRMVGELVHVGKGKEANEISKTLTAPASGLTLIRVEY